MICGPSPSLQEIEQKVMKQLYFMMALMIALTFRCFSLLI